MWALLACCRSSWTSQWSVHVWQTLHAPGTWRQEAHRCWTAGEKSQARADLPLVPSPLPSLPWSYCAGVLDHSRRRAEDLTRTLETRAALFTHIFQHDERHGCAAAWTFPDCRRGHLNDPSQLKSKWCLLEELRSVHTDIYMTCHERKGIHSFAFWWPKFCWDGWHWVLLVLIMGYYGAKLL